MITRSTVRPVDVGAAIEKEAHDIVARRGANRGELYREEQRRPTIESMIHVNRALKQESSDIFDPSIINGSKEFEVGPRLLEVGHCSINAIEAARGAFPRYGSLI